MARTGSTRLVNNGGGVNMRNRFISTTSAAAGLALALMLPAAVPATAQTAKTAAKSAIHRMPDGHPNQPPPTSSVSLRICISERAFGLDTVGHPAVRARAFPRSSGKIIRITLGFASEADGRPGRITSSESA